MESHVLLASWHELWTPIWDSVVQLAIVFEDMGDEAVYRTLCHGGFIGRNVMGYFGGAVNNEFDNIVSLVYG